MSRPIGTKNTKPNLTTEEKADRIRFINEKQKLYSRKHVMIINGKSIKVNKRPRPNECEICGYDKPKLDYHHWDDDRPEKGLWLCGGCHKMAGKVERDLHIKYLQLKQEVEEQWN